MRMDSRVRGNDGELVLRSSVLQGGQAKTCFHSSFPRKREPRGVAWGPRPILVDATME